MTNILRFYTFVTFTAIVVVLHCNSDGYPPPTELSYEWLDGFTVNVSWKKPTGPLDNLSDGEIRFLLKTNPKDSGKCLHGSHRSYTESLLTSEMDSDYWTFRIWTVCVGDCLNESEPATQIIYPRKTRKPRDEVVKDFKCFLHSKKCSWIPANPSLKVTAYHSICEQGKIIKNQTSCDQPGVRNGCDLQIDTYKENVCILVETEAAMSTFKPLFVTLPPNLTISEEEDHLKLSWTENGKGCFEYEFCYNECNKPKGCQNTTNGEPTDVPYDKKCLYKFRSRAMSSKYCFDRPLLSNFSEEVLYGSNEAPDGTLTVVAIVIPILLSVSVILSCYCFRRYSAIICPIVPDPSVIFKEMMTNGNKELKTPAVSLYTPVPEPCEPCKITM